MNTVGSDSEPLVLGRGITKVYRSRLQERETIAIRDVSFGIKPGEFLTLVGRSGCGKSTLLRIVAGLLAPSSGEVLWRGEPKMVMPDQQAIVFQTPALLPWRTVSDNVLLPQVIAGVKPDRRRAEELLATVGLQGSGNKYPSELSGGMQQRTSIARALLREPNLLLMDEPFGALDAMTRDTLNDELESICMSQGVSVLFVTHSIREAVRLSDRILVMGDAPGRILEDVPVPIDRPRAAHVGSDVLELERKVRELVSLPVEIEADIRAGANTSAPKQ